MLRILYVITSLTRGGAERQLVTLARAIKRRNCIVRVAILRDCLDQLSWLDDVGIDVIRCPRKGPIGLRGILTLAKTIRDFRPDIIHTFLPDADNITRVLRLLWPLAVLINSERSSWRQTALRFRLFERITSRLAHHLIANSESGANFAVAHRSFRRDQVSVIHNGIDPAMYIPTKSRAATRKELGLLEDQFVVLRIGALRHAKNYELLLEIADLLSSDSRFVFLCAGASTFEARGDDRSYPEKIVHLRETRYAGSDVRFIGHHESIANILTAADMSISTSRREGFPNSLLEAQYFGHPVVTTPAADSATLVVNELTGWVIPEDRPTLFAEHIAELADNPELKKLFSDAAAQRIRRHFTADSLAASTLEVYQTVLGRVRPNRVIQP